MDNEDKNDIIEQVNQRRMKLLVDQRYDKDRLRLYENFNENIHQIYDEYNRGISLMIKRLTVYRDVPEISLREIMLDEDSVLIEEQARDKTMDFNRRFDRDGYVSTTYNCMSQPSKKLCKNVKGCVWDEKRCIPDLTHQAQTFYNNYIDQTALALAELEDKPNAKLEEFLKLLKTKEGVDKYNTRVEKKFSSDYRNPVDGIRYKYKWDSELQMAIPLSSYSDSVSSSPSLSPFPSPSPSPLPSPLSSPSKSRVVKKLSGSIRSLGSSVGSLLSPRTSPFFKRKSIQPKLNSSADSFGGGRLRSTNILEPKEQQLTPDELIKRKNEEVKVAIEYTFEMHQQYLYESQSEKLDQDLKSQLEKLGYKFNFLIDTIDVYFLNRISSDFKEATEIYPNENEMNVSLQLEMLEFLRTQIWFDVFKCFESVLSFNLDVELL